MNNNNNFTTPKERDAIDMLTQRKIAVRVRLLHLQRGLRALSITSRLCDAAQADIAMNDRSGGPIDQTFVRLKSTTQQSLVGLTRSLERCQSEIADCNAKIADVQRKAQIRAGTDDGIAFDNLDQDIRNFLADGTPDE
jgi:hypothetical protein